MKPGIRALAALAGVAAGAVAVAVAELVAVGTGARSAPLVAVGAVVVDHVPEPVKELAVRLFFTYDKLALLIGIGALLAAFAALVGALARRRLWYGLAGIGLFGVVGLLAALTRHGATPAYALPSIVGAFAGGGVLALLVRRLPADAAVPADGAVAGTGPDDAPRRRFLRLVGAALAAAAVGGFGGRWLAQRRGVSAARAAVTLPAPASPAPALPPEADQRVPRLAPFVTPNRDFYLIDTALVVPQVDPRAWRLRVYGRVRRELTLTYDELMARPMIERYVTLACVSNEVGGGLISTARWLGVPLKDLLDEAAPDDDADQVVSRSADDFTAGTPTAVLRDGRDAMLAVGMNGEPLPLRHGFPVRMVVPGLYGYVSATKWLVELELSRFGDYDAYWVRRGWARRAPIKTSSRIDTPVTGGHPDPGPVVVAGVAWAQHRGIAKVEVRVDDGPWQSARLGAVPSIDTWRQWSWVWQAAPGRHRLQVRATDNAGDLQEEAERPPLPDGATGWHTIEVTVGG
jgi:DMSO/TMAO reductase YedYZ molybdopterin-dependent catalytic subunit